MAVQECPTCDGMAFDVEVRLRCPTCGGVGTVPASDVFSEALTLGRRCPSMSEGETRLYVEMNMGRTLTDDTWEEIAVKLGFM